MTRQLRAPLIVIALFAAAFGGLLCDRTSRASQVVHRRRAVLEPTDCLCRRLDSARAQKRPPINVRVIGIGHSAPKRSAVQRRSRRRGGRRLGERASDADSGDFGHAQRCHKHAGEPRQKS